MKLEACIKAFASSILPPLGKSSFGLSYESEHFCCPMSATASVKLACDNPHHLAGAGGIGEKILPTRRRDFLSGRHSFVVSVFITGTRNVTRTLIGCCVMLRSSANERNICYLSCYEPCQTLDL